MCHQMKIQLKPKMKKQELHDAITKQIVLWHALLMHWHDIKLKIEFK
jgi:hypothetical protein